MNKQVAEKVIVQKEQESNTKEALHKLGKSVYEKYCTACHLSTGKGMPPAFPALVGSKMTVGEVETHINIVLNGKKGTAMQAFSGQLTDREIAAVVTYERNAWDNDNKQKHGAKAGGVVMPEQVKKIRQ